jgi:cation transport protein ChaC
VRSLEAQGCRDPQLHRLAEGLRDDAPVHR